jgi:hypothetical protein
MLDTTVAGATIFLYDYFLTFGMEVDLVWSFSLEPHESFVYRSAISPIF